MEEQAEGLAELCSTDEQLKELYDSLEEEDRKDREELKYLREQQRKINLLLDDLGVPRRTDSSMMSIYERVAAALKQRSVA